MLWHLGTVIVTVYPSIAPADSTDIVRSVLSTSATLTFASVA